MRQAAALGFPQKTAMAGVYGHQGQKSVSCSLFTPVFVGEQAREFYRKTPDCRLSDTILTKIKVA
jgi:hypothetical protein